MRAGHRHRLSHPCAHDVGMFFEARCAGCDRPGVLLCRRCRLALAAPSGLPESSDVIAAVPFRGCARSAVLALKRRHSRPLAHHLAGLLVNRLVREGVDPRSIDVVTWAPTTRRHRRRRGFDQAEVIARRVGLQLGVPVRRLLERTDATTQTGADRATRLLGPSYRVSPAASGRRVLLIDDVATTGATLRSGDRALRDAGAADVVRAAVAITPAEQPAHRRPRTASHAAVETHAPGTDEPIRWAG